MKNLSARFSPLFLSLTVLLASVGCDSGPNPTQSSVPAGVTPGAVAPLVAEILAREDRIARTAGFASLLQDLPEEYLDEVLEGFEGAFLEWGDNEPVLLAEWWTRFDPLAAKAWSNTTWVADHPRVGLTIMRAMARTDPQLALEVYFDEGTTLIGEASEYPDSLEAIVIGWYESGKPGVLDFVKSQPSTELRQQTLGTLARLVVLDRGSEAAIAWAEARVAEDSGPVFVRQLQQRIAGAVAEDEPARAAAWVEELIAQGAHGSLPRRVAARWVKRDPEGALLWLENFEGSAFGGPTVAHIWNVWAGLDSERAHAWLREQGDKAYGFLAPALARSIRKQVTDEQRTGAPSDFEGQLSESLRIEDPDVRWGSVAFVARFWRLQDEEAAEAWVAENGVPAAYVETIRGPLPGGLRGLFQQEARAEFEGANEF